MPTPPTSVPRLAALGLLIAVAAAADPVPVRSDRWTMAPTAGYPVQGVGWETLTYARAIRRHVFQGNYHCGGSEPNQALLGYDFAANRWDVLDMTGSLHRENTPQARHPRTRLAHHPNHPATVLDGCASGRHH